MRVGGPSGTSLNAPHYAGSMTSCNGRLSAGGSAADARSARGSSTASRTGLFFGARGRRSLEPIRVRSVLKLAAIPADQNNGSQGPSKERAHCVSGGSAASCSKTSSTTSPGEPKKSGAVRNVLGPRGRLPRRRVRARRSGVLRAGTRVVAPIRPGAGPGWACAEPRVSRRMQRSPSCSDIVAGPPCGPVRERGSPVRPQEQLAPTVARDALA